MACVLRVRCFFFLLLSSWVCCACVCVHGVVIFFDWPGHDFFLGAQPEKNKERKFETFSRLAKRKRKCSASTTTTNIWVSRNCLIIVTCCWCNRGGEISMRSSDWNHWLIRKQLISSATYQRIRLSFFCLFSDGNNSCLARSPAWKSWREVSAQMNIAGCRWWPGWVFFTCWSSSSHAWASCRLRLPKPR